VWDRVFAVNVRGTWLCIKHAVPLPPVDVDPERSDPGRLVEVVEVVDDRDAGRLDRRHARGLEGSEIVESDRVRAESPPGRLEAGEQVVGTPTLVACRRPRVVVESTPVGHEPCVVRRASADDLRAVEAHRPTVHIPAESQSWENMAI
jgi:hypothetical protein